MNEKDNNILPASGNELVSQGTEFFSIFRSDEEIHGHDVLKMNDLFGNCISLLNNQVSRYVVGSNALKVTPEMIGSITGFLSGLQDSQNLNILIGDLEHLSADVKKKLKKGIYRIAESKMVDGNSRAVVVDSKNTIMAQITLKQVLNTSAVLSDINALVLQAALQNISEQLQNLGRDVKYLIEFTRRENHQVPFFNARDMIKEAASMDMDGLQVQDRILRANQYLIEGLNSLYSDLEANVQKLAGLNLQWNAKIEDIDVCLQYITEDMNLIPKYVGLRAYIYAFFGDAVKASEVLDEYRYKINQLATKPVYSRGLTAAQCIHKYFPYTDQNRDYWITDISSVNKQLQSITIHMSLEGKQVYQISILEEHENGIN